MILEKIDVCTVMDDNMNVDLLNSGACIINASNYFKQWLPRGKVVWATAKKNNLAIAFGHWTDLQLYTHLGFSLLFLNTYGEYNEITKWPKETGPHLQWQLQIEYKFWLNMKPLTLFPAGP